MDKVEVRARAWAILAAMGFGAFIAQMFGSVIGNALPKIQSDLDLSLSSATWAASSYFLAFAVGLIAGGRMGDAIGEVKMIVIGYSVFGVALITAALANEGAILILSRSVQGLGIGISAPATLSIVINTFPIARRGLAIGTWGAAHGFGIAFGPLLGGVLVKELNWRYIFWVTVPLTVIVILVTLWATRGYKSVTVKGRYDIIGLVVGGIGITAFTYGLQIGGTDGWTAASTLGWSIGGLVLLVVFYFVERHVKFPIVDFTLFRERLFSGGFSAEFSVGLVYLPMLTFIGSFYLIGILGKGPLEAGWLILPTTGLAAILQPFSGRIMDKFGPGRPVFVGMMLAAVSLFWLTTITDSTLYSALIIPFVIMGIAVSLVLPGGNTAGMLAVDNKQAGMGAGVLQMAFVLCNAVGIALVTSLIGALSQSNVSEAVAGKPYATLAENYAATKQVSPSAAEDLLKNSSSDIVNSVHSVADAAFTSALATSMLILGILAVIGGVVAIVFMGKRKRADHVHAEGSAVDEAGAVSA